MKIRRVLKILGSKKCILDLPDIDLWGIDKLNCLPRKGFEDIFITYLQEAFKTFLEDLFSVTIFVFQDLFKMSCEMCSRLLQDVLENGKLLHWRHVEDIFKTCFEVVLKTPAIDSFFLSIGKVFFNEIFHLLMETDTRDNNGFEKQRKKENTVSIRQKFWLRQTKWGIR